MTTSEIINARNEIANLALAGDNRYSHEAINASAVATASRTAAALPRLTAEAVSARAAAAEAFAAESGVLVTEAAPFMGGWSFFAHCVGPCGDRGAAVMEAIRRLGFVPSRHEVNDRRQRGATFYAKVAK